MRQCSSQHWLTHWGRLTHICVGKLTTIGSDNGLSPGRRQAIIWTNAGILLIWPLGTNFNEILIGIQTFSFKKMHLKMSSAKCRPFCLSLNVLRLWFVASSVPCYFLNLCWLVVNWILRNCFNQLSIQNSSLKKISCTLSCGKWDKPVWQKSKILKFFCLSCL